MCGSGKAQMRFSSPKKESPQLRLADVAILLAFLAGAGAAAAQTQPRPTYPTRDPHTPGYVAATELADGLVPSPSKDGNFIIGPTHEPAQEMSVKPGVPQGTVTEFTMTSADSKFYPGIARDPG